MRSDFCFDVIQCNLIVGMGGVPLCLRLMVFTLSEAFLQTIRHPYSCVRHIKGFISIFYQKVKRWQFISKGYRPT